MIESEFIKIVIVAPVYNRKEVTLKCLKSISRLQKDDLEIHTIIVDDGSTDGTADAINEEFPDVEIVVGDGNLFYTGGTNRGIEAALLHDPKYVLAINDDSVFDEDSIKIMIECAETHPRSVIGALLLNWETPHKILQVSPQWKFWLGGMRHWRKQTVWSVPEGPWETELIVGNCVLYPVEAIRNVGLMNEALLPQFGDAEYTPRMRRKGWRLLIEPRARVFCKPNDETTGFRHLSLTRMLRELMSPPTGAYSVRRRIYANLAAAPNRLQGLLALPIFYFRVLLGINSEGRWGDAQPEKPLRDTYAESPLAPKNDPFAAGN
ncbi:MAG: glycosyltransferase family 2 protein [Acidobacteriota bacterium]